MRNEQEGDKWKCNGRISNLAVHSNFDFYHDMKWSSIPITPTNLTLSNTLPVGQSFLWHRNGDTYSRAIKNPSRVIFLRQTDTELQYASTSPVSVSASVDNDSTSRDREWIDDYFQLSYDLPTLYTEWRGRDPGLFGRTEMDSRAVGVRVLRQDPFECLIG